MLQSADPCLRCSLRACFLALSSDSKATTRLYRARTRLCLPKPRNRPPWLLWHPPLKTLSQFLTVWRKSGWCMNACPRFDRMRIRCPQSHSSCTRSSLGPRTPCGTVSCNLVYIAHDTHSDLSSHAPLQSPGPIVALDDATRPEQTRSL